MRVLLFSFAWIQNFNRFPLTHQRVQLLLIHLASLHALGKHITQTSLIHQLLSSSPTCLWSFLILFSLMCNLKRRLINISLLSRLCSFKSIEIDRWGNICCESWSSWVKCGLCSHMIQVKIAYLSCMGFRASQFSPLSFLCLFTVNLSA